MAGVWYIWIMAAFFIVAAGVTFLLAGIFWIGHWLEKRETGATHGFLELPHELRKPENAQTQSEPAAEGGEGDDPSGKADAAPESPHA